MYIYNDKIVILLELNDPKNPAKRQVIVGGSSCDDLVAHDFAFSNKQSKTFIYNRKFYHSFKVDTSLFVHFLKQ